MKNSISNVWLLMLVVGFILLFSAYLTVTLNYSKAFKIKNEVLTIIEKRKGITTTTGNDSVPSKIRGGNVTVPKSAVGVINVFLQGSGYYATGNCNETGENWIGVKSLRYETGVYDIDNPAKPNQKYYYCFQKKARIHSCTSGNNLTMEQCHYKNVPYYYDVLFFYKLDVPMLGDLFTFRVDGMTADIYNIAADTYDCTCA